VGNRFEYSSCYSGRLHEGFQEAYGLLGALTEPFMPTMTLRDGSIGMWGGPFGPSAMNANVDRPTERTDGYFGLSVRDRFVQ